MKIRVIIEKNKNGLYSAYTEDDLFELGFNGQGFSVEQAKNEIYTIYKEMKDAYIQKGEIVPDLDFEFVFDLASFLDYYSKYISREGLSQLTGVKQSLLTAYITGKKEPEKETVNKIVHAIHRFGNELNQINIAP